MNRKSQTNPTISLININIAPVISVHYLIVAFSHSFSGLYNCDSSEGRRSYLKYKTETNDEAYIKHTLNMFMFYATNILHVCVMMTDSYFLQEAWNRQLNFLFLFCIADCVKYF